MTRLERLMSGIVPVWVVGLALLERLSPLRQRKKSGLAHAVQNLAVASLAAPVVAGLERPLGLALARRVEHDRTGLLNALPLPRAARSALGLLLLDYTMYLWHRATHRVPALWHFHRLHHVDPDLATSTAVRFHPGELLLSVPLRMLQIRLIGVDTRTLRLWQSLFFASVAFHHSNVRLPWGLERLLAALLVTPRLHGVHHSVDPDERNSNWSSGLTLWDVLHGTFRPFGAQPPTIGL